MKGKEGERKGGRKRDGKTENKNEEDRRKQLQMRQLPVLNHTGGLPEGAGRLSHAGRENSTALSLVVFKC